MAEVPKQTVAKEAEDEEQSAREEKEEKKRKAEADRKGKAVIDTTTIIPTTDEEIERILDRILPMLKKREETFERWTLYKIQSKFSQVLMMPLIDRKELIAMEEDILTWAETDSTENALEAQTFILLNCVRDMLIYESQCRSEKLKKEGENTEEDETLERLKQMAAEASIKIMEEKEKEDSLDIMYEDKFFRYNFSRRFWSIEERDENPTSPPFIQEAEVKKTPSPAPNRSPTPSDSILEDTSEEKKEEIKAPTPPQEETGYVSETDIIINKVVVDIQAEELEDGEIGQTEALKTVETAEAVETAEKANEVGPIVVPLNSNDDVKIGALDDDNIVYDYDEEEEKKKKAEETATEPVVAKIKTTEELLAEYAAMESRVEPIIAGINRKDIGTVNLPGSLYDTASADLKKAQPTKKTGTTHKPANSESSLVVVHKVRPLQKSPNMPTAEEEEDEADFHRYVREKLDKNEAELEQFKTEVKNNPPNSFLLKKIEQQSVALTRQEAEINRLRDIILRTDTNLHRKIRECTERVADGFYKLDNDLSRRFDRLQRQNDSLERQNVNIAKHFGLPDPRRTEHDIRADEISKKIREQRAKALSRQGQLPRAPSNEGRGGLGQWFEPVNTSNRQQQETERRPPPPRRIRKRKAPETARNLNEAFDANIDLANPVKQEPQ